MQVAVFQLENYAGPENFPLVRATEQAVGLELYAAEDMQILPGERALVGTGIKIAMPTGMEAQVRPKSGRAWKEGLTVLNTPGTIDPDYRGEVKVIVYNSNPVLTVQDFFDAHNKVLHWHESAAYQAVDAAMGTLAVRAHERIIEVKRGEKLAQLVFMQYAIPDIEQVFAETYLGETVRAGGGFGSTGL